MRKAKRLKILYFNGSNISNALQVEDVTNLSYLIDGCVIWLYEIGLKDRGLFIFVL
jgi:hypothetical protein